MGAKWYNVMDDYFGTHLAKDSDKARRWAGEMKHEFPHISDDAICKGIRWAARQDPPIVSSRFATVDDLLKICRQYIQSRRAKEYQESQVKCQRCRHGWLDFWPEIKAPRSPGMTMELFSLARCVALPCICTTGAIRRAEYPEHQRDRLAELAKLALDQGEVFEDLAVQVAQAIDGAGGLRSAVKAMAAGMLTTESGRDRPETTAAADCDSVPF